MGLLHGKIAVVMGAGRGIGAACAARLAREGATMALGDILGPEVEDVAERIVADGGIAHGACVDVSREDHVRDFIADTIARHGRIDILHNNAAPTNLLAKDCGIADTDVAVWDGTFACITRGTFLACKHVIPHMRRQGGGAIVNTSSMAAQRGTWLYHAYGAAKAGIDSLTKSIATCYGKDGIRCNAIAPGLIVRDDERAKLDAGFTRQWLDVMMTPRIGIDSDIASALVFLAQDASVYITGQVLAVDGGTLAWAPWGRINAGGVRDKQDEDEA